MWTLSFHPNLILDFLNEFQIRTKRERRCLAILFLLVCYKFKHSLDLGRLEWHIFSIETAARNLYSFKIRPSIVTLKTYFEFWFSICNAYHMYISSISHTFLRCIWGISQAYLRYISNISMLRLKHKNSLKIILMISPS